MALQGALLTTVLAACSFGDSNDKTATDQVEGVPVTAVSIPNLQRGREEATLTIADGKFDVDELTLQEGEPTILHIVNKDGSAYRLEIVPALVTPSTVTALNTTDIGFTTPNPADYTGRLLPSDGDQALDTFDVTVQSAGAVQP